MDIVYTHQNHMLTMYLFPERVFWNYILNKVAMTDIDVNEGVVLLFN